MKGLRILGDRRAELANILTPEPRSGWVLVRSTMSAVCGSDLHIYRQRADQVGDRTSRVAGHEAVGVVEEVGSGVEGLAPGTRIVVYQHHGCGRCSYCRMGEPMFCANRRTLGNHIDGADAEFVAAPASICLPLPDSLSDEATALLACNFGTAFSGVRKLKLDGGDVVVVFGLGPVGCCAVVVATSDGADVVAVDPVERRRDLAVSLGAAHTVDPTTSEARATVQELTHGRGAEASVDCSGDPRAQSDALDVLRAKGRMLVLAATAPWTFDPSQLWRRGLTVFGSWVYALGEYEGVVRLADKKVDSLEKLVTRSFAGAEAEAAFAAADKASEGKIVIDWTRAGS
jgi:threonine dehydrogenase-like Zn-dependent dehydrogenase